MDGMSMTSGWWTMAVEVLLVRPSHFLIFLIAFVCIFLMVEVVMVSTAHVYVYAFGIQYVLEEAVFCGIRVCEVQCIVLVA